MIPSNGKTKKFNIKLKYWYTTHHFGIYETNTFEDALEIDRKTGILFCTEAIEKEIKNAQINFEKLNGVTPEETE